jgi:hypothetical protein
MEEALLKLEKKNKVASDLSIFSPTEKNGISQASAALAAALKQLLDQLKDFSAESKQNTFTVDQLIDMVKAIPSELDPPHLVRAIWSASRLDGEAQQQAALFDALGEGGMNVLFEIAEHLEDIRRIPESQLPGPKSRSTDTSIPEVMVDVEEERRQFLLQEARTAAQVAAFAQAEADLASNGAANGSGTHTVTRKSDVQAQKAAKKAAKKAQQAWQAAKDAGAIVDNEDWIALSQISVGSGGLMGRTTQELQQLQQSLFPEGSRQYHEKQGLPGTEREFGEGYEKVVIPAARRDETKLHRRLSIAEIMDSQCAKAFAGTSSLNPMQSTVFETAFHRRDNLLICAPTGMI